MFVWWLRGLHHARLVAQSSAGCFSRAVTCRLFVRRRRRRFGDVFSGLCGLQLGGAHSAFRHEVVVDPNLLMLG